MVILVTPGMGFMKQDGFCSKVLGGGLEMEACACLD